jgi:hypothetical protein
MRFYRQSYIYPDTVGDGYHVCSSLRRPPIAGVTLLRKCIKRVVCRLFHNHALTYGCLEAEEVSHGNEVCGLYVFREN